MEDSAVKREVRFSDYLSILYKWKKFLIINVLVVLVLSIVYSLLIPKTYKATATIMLAQDNSMGGLSSLLSEGGPLSIGAKLFGAGSTSEDLILGILNTKSLMKQIINEFNLYEYYGFDNDKLDKTIKAFRADLTFEPNEFGLIEISVINENPQLAAIVSNRFVDIADSAHKSIKTTQAKNYRIFIESRFTQNVNDLKTAEDDFTNFQKKHGVFAVPAQIELAARAGAELESNLVENQIMLYSLKGEMSEKSSLYLKVENKIEAIKKKIDELELETENTEGTRLLIPFRKVPDLQIAYLRQLRNIEAQNKIMEFLYPLYEQAKIEEQKSTPTLLTIDRATPPQLKYQPKRAFIVIGITFTIAFLLIPLVLILNAILKQTTFNNTLEKKFQKIAIKLSNFYGLKL